MKINPLTALQILASLVKRTPLTDAEVLGAQAAVEQLEASLKELESLKAPCASSSPASD